jgi:Mn-dependent DtxR family transcriptional regulator
MNDNLSIDEFDALTQISKAPKNQRPSACVARNVKRLSGLKYVTYGKDGSLALSDKGKQILFIKNCIDGLRAVSNDPFAKLDAGVVTFLSKKGHITARDAGGFDITQKGRETLEDIDAANS